MKIEFSEREKQLVEMYTNDPDNVYSIAKSVGKKQTIGFEVINRAKAEVFLGRLLLEMNDKNSIDADDSFEEATGLRPDTISFGIMENPVITELKEKLHASVDELFSSSL